MPPKREEKVNYLTRGIHKFVDIEEVPFDYLQWWVDNMDSDKDPANYEVVENEYIRRKNRGR